MEKNVKSVLFKCDFSQWKIACLTYKTLNILNYSDDCHQLSPCRTHAYHDPRFTKLSRQILRLLPNVNGYGQSQCKVCDSFNVNSVQHILFECRNIADIQEIEWLYVQQNCP